jgi:hypothetical protein
VIPFALLAALLTPASPASPASSAFPDGEALIRAMEQRYHGKWYRTLTFVQTTTMTQPAPRVETWYEAARIPGVLRIDIAPLDSGNTILFRGDSLYRFQGATLKASRAFVHPLMVLGFDVYADPVEKTIARLRGLGFDLSRIREDTWQGRPAYVVGAEAGDSTTGQFWIDRERLVFVRMLQAAPDGSGHVVETQFNRYQPLGKGWISVEVLFSVNGELRTREEYADVKADLALPDALFDPGAYARPGWVNAKR